MNRVHFPLSIIDAGESPQTTSHAKICDDIHNDNIDDENDKIDDSYIFMKRRDQLCNLFGIKQIAVNAIPCSVSDLF